MWIPIPLNLVLANIRPWTVSDFTSQWVSDLAHGGSVAIVSTIAIPVLGALLVAHQLRPVRAAIHVRPAAVSRLPRFFRISSRGG
jgi:hypothetical protein